jgi:hypothetical protein
MARVNYSVIAQKYRNVGKGNVRLTQSSLFLTKPINPAVTTYTFDVLETQTASLQNDEIRLNLNDEFIVTQIGMYLVGNVNGTSGRVLLTCPPYELNTVQADRLTDFYNGTFVNLRASRISDEVRRGMKIIYSSGKIEIDFVKRTVINTTPYDIKELNGGDPLGESVANFVMSVKGLLPSMVTAEQARRALNTALMIEEEVYNARG